MSENGWTDDFLCMQWFMESSVPQATARNESGAPILLIYNGHGSHMTDEMRKLAEKHNIELFCLPPHMTHRTQPLDVGVFGPLQRRWQEHCDEVLEATDEEICKADFIKEYMAARDLAFIPSTITKAWEKCGIHPHNPNIFTDADFAPSASTLKVATLLATTAMTLTFKQVPTAMMTVDQMRMMIVTRWPVSTPVIVVVVRMVRSRSG
jgi:hypothetical protein